MTMPVTPWTMMVDLGPWIMIITLEPSRSALSRAYCRSAN